MWSKDKQKAVELSFKAHEGQARKGSGLPYVTHPVSVGMILENQKMDGDVVIAGLLHDLLEDTEFIKKDIEEKFNDKVARLVEEVSEDCKDLPWKERKEKATAELLEASQEGNLIKAADKIANTTDLICELERKGEEAFKIFNASPEQKVKQLKRVKVILEIKLGRNKLMNKLEENINEIEKWV